MYWVEAALLHQGVMPESQPWHADLRCAWRMQGATVDGEHVHAQLVNTMREILTVRDWWQLPRFVYGSSRGGAMALIMAQRFPFQVRCNQLSAKVCRMANSTTLLQGPS